MMQTTIIKTYLKPPTVPATKSFHPSTIFYSNIVRSANNIKGLLAFCLSIYSLPPLYYVLLLSTTPDNIPCCLFTAIKSRGNRRGNGRCDRQSHAISTICCGNLYFHG